MNINLKPGDIVTADNVLLMYDGDKFIVAKDSLDYSSMFVFDDDTDAEYEVEYGAEDLHMPYYVKSKTYINKKINT